MEYSFITLTILVLMSAALAHCTVESAGEEQAPTTLENKSRAKRSVINLPNKSAVLVTIDYQIPVNPLNASLVYFNVKLPFRFFMPTYDQLTGNGRVGDGFDRYNEIEEERSHQERRSIYKQMESVFTSWGVDGLACLQRVICELSEAPLAHNDLVGNIISMVFTPPRVSEIDQMADKNDKDDSSDPLDEPYRDEYLTAYLHGKQGSCSSKYASTCPISLFTFFNL